MEDYKEALENLPMKGHFNTVRAIEIAVAGKHNILNTGAPGCGKTLLTQTLMPALTPKLTEEYKTFKYRSDFNRGIFQYIDDSSGEEAVNALATEVPANEENVF